MLLARSLSGPRRSRLLALANANAMLLKVGTKVDPMMHKLQIPVVPATRMLSYPKTYGISKVICASNIFKAKINDILSGEDRPEIEIVPIAGAEVSTYLPLKTYF
jgi:hypothetical protein